MWVSLAWNEIEPLLRLPTVNLIKLRSFGFDRWNSKYLKVFKQICLLKKPAASCKTRAAGCVVLENACKDGLTAAAAVAAA